MSDPMIYRRSAIGMALTDSLDELIQSGLLDPPLAMKILSQFDTSISESLKTNVKTKGSFKGHLDVYRFCEDVWVSVFVVMIIDFCCEWRNVSIGG
jgi:transcription initiation factor TFIIA small subunit